MASHFSCIGFPVPDMPTYWALARQAAKAGERLPAPDGTALVQWAVGAGPELWAQIDRAGEVIGATPFFSTGITYRMAVTGSGEAPEEPMDGWIDGWIEPAEDDEPFSGAFPLRVDLIDYSLVRPRLSEFPRIHRVELVALAHEVDLYPDETAYTRSKEEIYQLPMQAFVSAAHFSVDDPSGVEESTAMASGYVDGSRLLTNLATEVPFWWIRFTTKGITLHVFADREMFQDEPRTGNVLSGSFWLLGRLQDERTTAPHFARTE